MMKIDEKTYARIFDEGMKSEGGPSVCPYEEGTDYYDLWVDGHEFGKSTKGTVFSTYHAPPLENSGRRRYR